MGAAGRTWPFCVAAPLVPLILFPTDWGRSMAVLTFFVSSACLVAYAFCPNAEPPSDLAATWAGRLTALAVASLTAFAVFTAVSLTWSSAQD